MDILSIGVLVRELRKSQGLTQEQLAEGICSRGTLSRIENDTQKPDFYVYKNLLMRLGMRGVAVTNSVEGIIVTDTEKYLIEVIPKVQELLSVHDYKGMSEMISEMENDSRFDSDFGRERLLMCKMVMNFDPEKGSLEKGMEITLDLIKLRRPDFELEKVEQYYLAADEYVRLNNYALYLYDLERYGEAVDLWQKLMASHEKAHRVRASLEEDYRMMFGNVASALMKSARYEECIEIADKALAIYLEYEDLRFYYRALKCKAYSLCKLGRMEEGRECFLKYCCMLYATGGDKMADIEIVNKDFGENFGIMFDVAALAGCLSK